MRHFVRRSFEICLLAVSYLCVSGNIAKAQVTPDNTVDTNVNQNGNVSEITGGQTRGDNLFHSFQDFSVPTGNEAFFDNADTIENIFSRVTGGNISNIDGLIRANGSASLFLVNPAGIIFGENARLDIGGSFLGSTADSILFPDNVDFSASDIQPQPVLTIDAPIGLSFRDNPQDITVRAGEANNDLTDITGLTVPVGQNLTLVGGDLNFDGGNITTTDGSVRLGSLDAAAVATLHEDGSLTFPDNIARGNVSLANASVVNVALGNRSGGIYINANNLNILSSSALFASADPNNPQTGDIIIDATESVFVDSTGSNNLSFIGLFSPKNESTGTGEINITTTKLSLNNGGAIFAGGGAGITLNATESININGINPIAFFVSGIFNQINVNDNNNAGNVDINTTATTILLPTQQQEEVTT